MVITLTLAPGVPDFAALGAGEARDLMAGDRLAGAGHAQEVRHEARSALFRLPLPGTPIENARPRGRPAGAGTGWIYLRRYGRAGLRESLAARLSTPRSASMAAREWNLLCHLRSHGVATPEPLALVAEGNPFFAARSALVTRALEGTLPLLEWLAAEPEASQRRLALRATGLCLGRLFQSGIELPRLGLRHLHVSTERSGTSVDSAHSVQVPGSCAAEQIVRARSAVAVEGVARGFSWQRLPDVALTSVRGGRLTPRPDAALAGQTLARLDAQCTQLETRERRRVASLALAGFTSTERRRAWRRLER